MITNPKTTTKCYRYYRCTHWSCYNTEDSTDPSSGSSIGAHILKATKQPSRPTQSIEDLLGAHSIDDAVWGGTKHVTCQLKQ